MHVRARCAGPEHPSEPLDVRLHSCMPAHTPKTREMGSAVLPSWATPDDENSCGIRDFGRKAGRDCGRNRGAPGGSEVALSAGSFQESLNSIALHAATAATHAAMTHQNDHARALRAGHCQRVQTCRRSAPCPLLGTAVRCTGRLGRGSNRDHRFDTWIKYNDV